MARVTVEDCLYVGTNYELVLMASKRARDIAEGAQPLLEEDGDKPVVIALREIAEKLTVEDAAAAELEMQGETIFDQDQDQSQEPIKISVG